MNIEKEYELSSLREKRKLNHIFKKIKNNDDHDPLFDKRKYHLLITDQGYYLKTTIAGTTSYTRIWRIDLEKNLFYLDQKKYFFKVKETA